MFSHLTPLTAVVTAPSLLWFSALFSALLTVQFDDGSRKLMKLKRSDKKGTIPFTPLKKIQ